MKRPTLEVRPPTGPGHKAVKVPTTPSAETSPGRDSVELNVKMSRMWVVTIVGAIVAVGGAIIGWQESREAKFAQRVKAEITTELVKTKAKADATVVEAKELLLKARDTMLDEHKKLDAEIERKAERRQQQILREIRRTRRAVEEVQ